MRVVHALCVVSVILLLALSSAQGSFLVSPVLQPNAVDPHGPRVTAIVFTTVPDQGTLFSSVLGGKVRTSQWPFDAADWRVLAAKNNMTTGIQEQFGFDGVAFNALRPYMNNINFRMAMRSLTDYRTVARAVLKGLSGTSTPFVLPCRVYASSCFQSRAARFSLLDAANELLRAGLVANLNGRLVCRGAGPGCIVGLKFTQRDLGGITAWYRHQNPVPGQLTMGDDCSLPLSQWGQTTRFNCQFQPSLYYPLDDPLRSGVALNLIASASRIRFTFNAVAISTSNEMIILEKSAKAVKTTSQYDPTTGYNSPNPTFDPAVVNGSDPSAVVDNWDMYVFSLSGGSSPTYQAQLLSSNSIGPSMRNFMNFFNSTLDFYGNRLFYATSIASARSAAREVGMFAQQQLPYIVSFFQNSLWADNTTLWGGLANAPGSGPNTGPGWYYTALNAHKITSPYGGVLTYALHGYVNKSGFDPLYRTTYPWASDIWGLVYDTPVKAPLSRFTPVTNYQNYMTSRFSTTTFSGTTGTGPGWFNMQALHPSSPANIVNGVNISLTFLDNITWTDHAPLTAADYNFSLYAWDLSIPPSLTHELTPLTGVLTGPEGLWATHVVGNRIDIFVNSTSIWNFQKVIVPVLPQHILQHFNINYFATKSGAVDTTLPYERRLGDFSSGAVGTCPDALCSLGFQPEWLTYLPSLEVGSGPFRLVSYNYATGSGLLLPNPNYFRTAWLANATAKANKIPVGTSQIVLGTLNNLTGVHPPVLVYTSPNEGIYNPTRVTFLKVKALSYGVVHIPGRNVTSATFAIYQGSNTTAVASGNINFDKNGNALTYVKVGAITQNPGTFKLVIRVEYVFLGLPRVWTQQTGFTVYTPV